MQFREENHIYYYIANGDDIKIIIYCYANSLILLPHSLLCNTFVCIVFILFVFLLFAIILCFIYYLIRVLLVNLH